LVSLLLLRRIDEGMRLHEWYVEEEEGGEERRGEVGSMS